MRISLDALLVLKTIHRTGSFAAAAEELHRVRSALTHSIQKLERDLGVALFDRSGHRSKLTPIGKVLLEKGCEILKSTTDLEQTIARLKHGWEEELSIAIDDTLSIFSLYPLIEVFYRECSWTRLKITTEILNGCWDALLNGRANLAIGITGDPAPGDEFGILPLCQIQFVFAVSPNHPLAILPEPLKSEEIIKHRAIVASDSARQLNHRSSGILSGQETLTVSSMHAKIQAQIRGLGVGFVPLNLINDEINQGRLVIKQVEKSKPPINLAVAWRLEQTGKAMKWFLENLKCLLTFEF